MTIGGGFVSNGIDLRWGQHVLRQPGGDLPCGSFPTALDAPGSPLVVTRLKVNPFIATFGTSSIFMGAAFLYANSKTFPFREESFRTLGSDRIFDVPWSVVVLIAVFAIGAIILGKTVYGRSLYAIGGNNEAARLSGLRVDVLRASTFVLVGACAALAGILIASRIGVGQPDMTRGTLALDAIAIVVIGGTSLFGGEGSVWRTAVGLLILAVLSNLFDSYAVQASTQQIIKGAIVVGGTASTRTNRR
jgi:ribose transport system permease protein